MKKLLTIIILMFSLSIFAQPGDCDGLEAVIIRPPVKTRSNNLFTQKDNFLDVSVSLGIPTTPNENCADLYYGNPFKLVYNTVLHKLRIWDGATWSDAFVSSGSSTTQEILLDSYNGTRLSPLNSALNGFHIDKSVNGNMGFSAFNSNDSGNGAMANITLKGSGALYTNNTGISHFGAAYYITYLRGNGALYSDKNLFVASTGVGTFIDFRTGNDLATATSKLKIASDGKVTIAQKLNIGNLPVYADNTAALAGTLIAGDIYRTSTGVLMIVY